MNNLSDFLCRLRFMAKLKSNDQDEKALAQYIMQRTVGDVAVFRIVVPSEGEFGLEIYANDPAIGGTTLLHAYQYLIICKQTPVGAVEPFPVLTAGYLGPQASFSEYGLTAASHADPFIQTNTGDLQVSFDLSHPLRMTSQLINAGENKDCSEYVLQQAGERNGVTFVVLLPKPGMYKVCK